VSGYGNDGLSLGWPGSIHVDSWFPVEGYVDRITQTLHKSPNIQGVHLYGQPENVREFDSCEGNVRDYTKN